MRGEPGTGGSAYFARLVVEVRALRPGDHLFFTDWRGDADELLAPDGIVRAVEAAAEALDAWHDGGRIGPRPPGPLRRHRPTYRLVYDPDGRPWRDRLQGRW